MLVTKYNLVEHTYYKGSIVPISIDEYSVNHGTIYTDRSIYVNGVKRGVCKYTSINSNDDIPLENVVTKSNLSSWGTDSRQTSYRLKCGKFYPYFSLYHSSTSLNAGFAITSKNDDLSAFEENLTNLSAFILKPSDSIINSFDFISIKINDELYVGMCQKRISNQGINCTGTVFCFDDVEENLGYFEKSEYDTDYGDFSSSGGYSGGSFDDSSDVIGIPAKPKLSISSMGFVNVYRPEPKTLEGMVDELFPKIDIPDIPTGETLGDVVNSLNGLIDTLANGILQFGNKNLLDYVLDAHIIPVKPAVGASTSIKVGYKTLSINAPKVSDDYVDFDCGTVNIKEYYSNYIDYITTFKLYLPFVGFVPINPEFIQNGRLNVSYRFNVMDGSFCCWVLSTSSKSKLSNTVIGSFSGNSCIHIPISSVNYSNILSGMVNGVSNTINAVQKGGIENVGKATESAENAVKSLKPDMALSNGYNATSSYSGIRVPYLLIERPVASFSENYPRENGLPLNVTKVLSEVSGFTVASNLILDKVGCTDVESEMIKAEFKGGVIL